MAQTYPKWELILADDESNDDSLSVAQKYARMDSRINVITKKHGGLPQTRNYALRQATGNYIALLDGDDYFAKDHLEKCNEILRDACDMLIINNHINFTCKEKNKVILFPFHSDINEKSKKEKMELIFSSENRLPASAVLTVYRKGFLKEHCFEYHEQYRCSEDLDFFLQNIMYAKTILFSDHEFYYYRQDNASAMTKNMTGAMLYDRLCIYEKWFWAYKGNVIDGFDGNLAADMLKRDMCESVSLFPKIDLKDGTRTKLRKYIYETKNIWTDKQFRHSYFFCIFIKDKLWTVQKALSLFKKSLIK